MGTRRVLVIDDEQIILDSISKILTEENFRVDTTLKGGTGISHAINEPYDLILTDIRMPDLDGLKVLREIRRLKPGIPIIIVTGYATISSAVEAMHLGATNYIEKPFTPEQLVETVTSAISKCMNEPPEAETLIHQKEMRRILKRGASDARFCRQILQDGVRALKKYGLTDHETLALVTGDADWIADQIGILPRDQEKWLMDIAAQRDLAVAFF